MNVRPLKSESLWEALEDCSLSDSNVPVLFWVQKPATRWRATLCSYRDTWSVPAQPAVDIRKSWRSSIVQGRMTTKLFFIREGATVSSIYGRLFDALPN